ncbi:MAG: hypothetical protein DWQ04_13385 [Chloroflexi bacterium]|nr:MAG: hypothetical protein DWQ04_13385 [Chloroflexota bacterium]
MTTFPGSPKLIKGAIIGVDKFNPLASVIVFQFNPDSLTRRLAPRVASSSGTGQQGDRGEVYRLKGPPEETISLKIEIDATDDDGSINPLSYTSGIAPTLSALEMLFYPKSAVVFSNDALANAGMLEIIPPEAPLTLFVWGPQRVLPVRVTSLNITEQAFDNLLNPIRAEVDISMTVLSYYDLKIDNPGYPLFMVHQVIKEIQATSNVLNSVQNVGSGLKF